MRVSLCVCVCVCVRERERECEKRGRENRGQIGARKIYKDRHRVCNGIEVAFIEKSVVAVMVHYKNLIVPGRDRTGL